MARVERGDVGLGDLGLGLELALQPVMDRFARTVEHPQREAQRPHVLRTQRVLVAQPVRLDRLDRFLADIEGEHVELAEAAVLERVGGILRFVEVALGEGSGIGDDQPAGLQCGKVHLERGGVHRHQHIGRITRSVDLAAAEIDLERRDAEQRALRRADFGREIGEGRKVVPRQRRRQRELPAGELHPVAGVSGKAYDNAFRGVGQAVLRQAGVVRGGCRHPGHPCLRPRAGAPFPVGCAT